VGRVDVEVARVDRNVDAGEVVDDRRVAERMHADADTGAAVADVATEDLADADLRRAVRLVLVADHPQRSHRARVVGEARAELDASVLRRTEADVRLRLADDGVRMEPVLADRRAD